MRGDDRLLIRLLGLAALMLPALLGTARAQTQNNVEAPFPVAQLRFNLHFGSRAATNAVYCLLGNGYFRAPSSGEQSAIIDAFVAAHPNAQVVPITVTTPSITAAGSKVPMIYVWVEEGNSNLNVNLVREGAYAGSVMLDVVQAFGSRIASMKDEEKPRRLVTDSRYEAFVDRVQAAQDAAKAEKKGVWSDEFQNRINPAERP